MTTDYARNVAEDLIRHLQEGTAPWQKPWKVGEQFMPYNPTTGKNYRGGNALVLMAAGYADSRWMTYRQASEDGFQVRKGEHGTKIQYWITQGTEPVIDADGKPVRDDNEKPLMRTVNYERPRVKAFTVFNAEQIDGIQPPPLRTVPEWQRHQRADSILSGSAAKISHHAGDRAYYQLSSDMIVLPEPGQFPSHDGYYATALHELGHWTGAAGRLDRDMGHPFGSAGYAREELRAEIASLMIGTEIGVGHDPSRHAAYVGDWIKALKNDPQEIFRAAADAEKIAAMLRGFEQTRQQDTQLVREQEQEAQSAGAVAASVRLPVLVREDHPVMESSNDRIYLAVPYAEKDQAKKLGAKWDRDAKAWFSPAGVDLAPFGVWIPPHEELHVENTIDPREEFAEALKNAGLQISGLPIMDGQIHRVPVVGDRNRQTSGAYAGHLDGHPAGYIENFKTGICTTWKSGIPTQGLGEQDRARLAAETAQKRYDRSAERGKMMQAAALTAEAAWNAAQPAAADHPYLVAKRILPGELRVGSPGQTIETTDKDGQPKTVSLEGRLLTPMRDIEGRLHSLQVIDPDGVKTFHKGGRLDGCHMRFGEFAKDHPIIIAEGIATAVTIHQATGLPVIAAFTAGNIAPVAQAYRDAHPERTVIIAGDNDHLKDQDRNVGRRKAEDAAVQVGGFTLLPDFAPDDHGTDWNDYARTNGMEATAQALMTGIRSAQAQALAVELHRKEEQSTAQAHQLIEERQEQAYENVEAVSCLVERQRENERSLEIGR